MANKIPDLYPKMRPKIEKIKDYFVFIEKEYNVRIEKIRKNPSKYKGSKKEEKLKDLKREIMELEDFMNVMKKRFENV